MCALLSTAGEWSKRARRHHTSERVGTADGSYGRTGLSLPLTSPRRDQALLQVMRPGSHAWARACWSRRYIQARSPSDACVEGRVRGDDRIGPIRCCSVCPQTQLPCHMFQAALRESNTRSSRVPLSLTMALRSRCKLNRVEQTRLFFSVLSQIRVISARNATDQLVERGA